MIYTLSTEKEGREALQAIGRRFKVRHESAPARRLLYFDTFDWRLHGDGTVLRAEDGADGPTARLGLERGPALVHAGLDGLERHRLALEDPRRVPAFAEDFPAGPLREALAPVIAMRRLLPRLEVERRDEILHLLDELEKTVVRVRLVLGTAALPKVFGEALGSEGLDAAAEGRAPLTTVLEVEPLRGFDAERAELTDFLAAEVGLEGSGHDELTMAMAAIGRRPRDYSSKLDLVWDGDEPAGAAARKIHLHLLEVRRRNLAGTRRDLDSEFLHDFRVAVRRTRSALSQIKGVFAPADVERFKAEFSWLGKLTGPTRDLDVYLLKIDAYEAALPEEIRQDLEPLREYLRRHQKIEQERLSKTLGDERYEALEKAWESFLKEPGKAARGAPEDAPNAERPLAEVAAERIYKAWRKVYKKGKAIDDDSPAEKLHRLRIDAKKLRYLLEFFRHLYAPKTIDPLIKALKKLQDNLGDFNDYEVQQKKLRAFAAGMEEEGLASVPTLLAMGELVAHLRKGQAKERRRFAKRFSAFARPENRRAFEELGAKP